MPSCLPEPRPLPVFLQPLVELMLKSGFQPLLRYPRLPDQRRKRQRFAGMMLQKDTHRIGRVDLCLSGKLTIYNSLFNNYLCLHRAGLKAYIRTFRSCGFVDYLRKTPRPFEIGHRTRAVPLPNPSAPMAPIKKALRHLPKGLVGRTGFEPVTPTMSR